MLVAWGFAEQGERVLLSVMLGMRESHEYWLDARPRSDRPRARRAAVDRGDGAPGLIRRSSSAGPASDRQHCCVHGVRNLLAKLPERERVRQAYWQALDDAVGVAAVLLIQGDPNESGALGAASGESDSLSVAKPGDRPPPVQVDIPESDEQATLRFVAPKASGSCPTCAT